MRAGAASRTRNTRPAPPRFVATVRTLWLSLVLLVAACRPALAEPTAPTSRPSGPDLTTLAARLAEPAAVAPAPAPTVAPEPPPTWAWAVSVLPELAAHSEVDPAVDALARFVGWFASGAKRVHVLLEGRCHAIAGEADADGFHGGWRTQVTVTGATREVATMDFDITRYGISESGPGGKIYERDERGRWREVGAFGTGSGAALVDHSMSAADERQVTFAGYWYRLEPVCREFAAIQQTCADGSPRVCRRCTGLALQRRAEHMAWSTPTVTIGRVDPVPADCSQPCPADEQTALLPRLAEVLKGRHFAGVLADGGPTVFRSAKDCDRERRRRARRPA